MKKFVGKKLTSTALALCLAVAPAVSALPVQAAGNSDAGPYFQTEDTTGWQAAYLQQLRAVAADVPEDEQSYLEYSLAYIDGDKTPELIVSGGPGAFDLLSYHNGAVADYGDIGGFLTGLDFAPGGSLVLIDAYLSHTDTQTLINVATGETHKLVDAFDGFHHFYYFDDVQISEDLYNSINSSYKTFAQGTQDDDLTYSSLPALLSSEQAQAVSGTAAPAAATSDGTMTLPGDGFYMVSNTPFDQATGQGMAFSLEKSRLILTTGALTSYDTGATEPLGTYVIPLASGVKYALYGGEDAGTTYMSRKKFNTWLQNQNGLGLILTVKNGKITEMGLSS